SAQLAQLLGSSHRPWMKTTGVRRGALAQASAPGRAARPLRIWPGRVTAVFVDGWTIQAVSHVAGLEESGVLELSEALARHSLVYLDSTQLGSRSRMLETVREFVAERLAARPDAAEFDQAFSAGFGPPKSQAVEIARDRRATGTHGA